MKKHLAAIGSLIFLFSIYIILITVGSTLLSIHFLWILLIVEILCIIWSFVVLINKKRRLETKVRWAVFIIFVPIFGIGSYFLFGRVYHYKTTVDYKYKNFADFREGEKLKTLNEEIIPLIEEDIPEYKRAFMMGLNQQSDLIYQNTRTEFLPNGNIAWSRIFEDLMQAKEYILINMYIVDDGELYRNLVQILKGRLKKGVRVYFLYDFFGAYGKFSRKMREELIEAGAEVIPFSPVKMPFLNWTINYRDHRKDISIDGQIGYTGGINLADEYVNLSKVFGFWNDAMIRIQGDAVQGIEKIFVSDWRFYTKKLLIDLEPKIGLPMSYQNDNHELVQVVSSGPNHATPMHLDLMLNLINSAQRRIWLSSPYFVPPVEMIKSLASAARSGIDVRLLLPGLSDKKFLLDVSKNWAGDLYDAGVKIYCINNTFNHTKMFLFDDEISFLGSTNLDFRAFFSDQQTMVLIKSQPFNQVLNDKFISDFELSFLYNFNPKTEHNKPYRLLVKGMNIIGPLL